VPVLRVLVYVGSNMWTLPVTVQAGTAARGDVPKLLFKTGGCSNGSARYLLWRLWRDGFQYRSKPINTPIESGDFRAFDPPITGVLGTKL
jgi:hypothetical protein